VGKTYNQLDERLCRWISDQQVFCVATAPSGPGAQTLAHLRDNGRITLMFCAFSGPPKILRLHGHGRVVLPGERSWVDLAARFPAHRGVAAYGAKHHRPSIDSRPALWKGAEDDR
jgi:hypothetical protein